MAEVTELINLIGSKRPLVAMLAPSFPIMYRYPHIVGKLKRSGFMAVVEVSAGALRTNSALVSYFENNADARVITSPCPSFVRMVRKKHPELMKYVVMEVDSPMAATARIVRDTYPGATPVFIGPCHAKKLEAKEDHADLGIIVTTYLELESLFSELAILDEPADAEGVFDISEGRTRIYPIDGGLTETSDIRRILRDDEIRIVSGWKPSETALLDFPTDTKIRLLDVLFCEGGCINGPGIASPLLPEERKRRILKFAGT